MATRVLYDYNEKLNFGKYDGYTVDELKEEDPSYLLWLAEEEVIRFHDADDQAAFEDAVDYARDVVDE